MVDSLDDVALHYWALEGDGVDGIGSEDLTLQNSPAFEAGIIGDAMTCAATGTKYAKWPNSAALNPGAASFLVGCFADAAFAAGSHRFFLGTSNVVGQSGWRVRSWSGQVWFEVSSGGTFWTSAKLTGISSGQHSFLGYHDTVANKIGLVIDGDWAGRATANFSGSVHTSTADAGIGASNTGSANLVGWIDALTWAEGFAEADLQALSDEYWNSGAGWEPTTGLPAVVVSDLVVSGTLGLVDGSVVLGAVSVSDLVATGTLGLVDGAVVLGPVSVTDLVVSGSLGLIDGAVLLGPVVVSDVVVAASLGLVDGSVVLGAVSVSGLVAIGTLGLVDGDVVLGAVSVAGLVAVGDLVLVDGTVVIGPVTVPAPPPVRAGPVGGLMAGAVEAIRAGAVGGLMAGRSEN